MRDRRKPLFALIGLVCALGAGVGACDLASDGIAMDATNDASTDATTEASSDAMDELADGATNDAQSDAPDDADAGPDAVVDSGTIHCGAGYVANCINCAGSPVLCALTDTCVLDCLTLCLGAPIECNACNGSNVQALAQCVSTGDASACIAAPNQRCTCTTDAGECPGATQACLSSQCWSCGENPPNTDNHVCKNGASCDTGGGSGNPLRYSCH